MTDEEKKQIEALVDSFDIAFAEKVKTELAKVKATLEKYFFDSASDEKIKKEVEQDDCNTQSDY